MKKVFEIEWDDKARGNMAPASLQTALETFFDVKNIPSANFKVKEIQPTNFCYAPMSVEYCECEVDNRYRAQDGKLYCSDPDCRKLIRPKPKEYCKCPKHLSVGVCCDVCHKPFKDKPKPPIEELDLESGEFEIYIVGVKVNQIIDWIETHSKESKCQD